mmetsp:Transcript_27181/g.35226  ORF Transcript_27181/g.35226 Transcript_27181/m.35226 type:complete len:110 (-) Transcript_27181:43-372(-)
MSHKPKVSIREDQPMQRVRRHRESIERIKNINGILKQSLARESRESRMTANLTTSVEMQKLQEQAEMYHKKIESERRKINKLDRDITDMEYKTLEQRQKNGRCQRFKRK